MFSIQMWTCWSTVRLHDVIDRYGIYVSQMTLVVKTSRSFPRSWLTTGFVTRLTRQVPLAEQELLTLPDISGVRVTRSLVLCVCFVDRYLSFCSFVLLVIVLSVLLRYTILITPLVSPNSSSSSPCWVKLKNNSTVSHDCMSKWPKCWFSELELSTIPLIVLVY